MAWIWSEYSTNYFNIQHQSSSSSSKGQQLFKSILNSAALMLWDQRGLASDDACYHEQDSLLPQFTHHTTNKTHEEAQ